MPGDRGGPPVQKTDSATPLAIEPDVPDGYKIREGTPSIEAFRRIRQRAGMTDRPAGALDEGLPNTTYGVYVDLVGDEAIGGDGSGDSSTDDLPIDASRSVAMGRIVGDGATAFLIVDVAVEEAHQGRGLGTAVVDALMRWLREHAPAGGYVYLFADVDDFYERWGFEQSAPASKGMWIRTAEL